MLTFVVRDVDGGLGVDVSVGEWGQRHATDFTDAVLEAITFFGDPTTVVVMAVVLAVAETLRTRSRWVIPYVLVVVAGNGLITTTIKHLADRVRPELNPIAETLGPSFPSGHSSWAAAFFACAALLLGRGRSRRTRITLAGRGRGMRGRGRGHARAARRALAQRRHRRASPSAGRGSRPARSPSAGRARRSGARASGGAGVAAEPAARGAEAPAPAQGARSAGRCRPRCPSISTTPSAT